MISVRSVAVMEIKSFNPGPLLGVSSIVGGSHFSVVNSSFDSFLMSEYIVLILLLKKVLRLSATASSVSPLGSLLALYFLSSK